MLISDWVYGITGIRSQHCLRADQMGSCFLADVCEDQLAPFDQYSHSVPLSRVKGWDVPLVLPPHVTVVQPGLMIWPTEVKSEGDTVKQTIIRPFFAAFLLPIALGATLGFAGPAAAGTPTISSVKATPKLVTSTNGAVVVSAVVSDSLSCSLSSPSFVSGLPVTSSCTTGTFSQNIVFPQNSGSTDVTYKLKFVATGETGRTDAKTIKVKVAPGAGQALPTAFTATYVGPGDEGEQDGNFSFSGVIDGPCTFNDGTVSSPSGSYCDYDLTSLSGSWVEPGFCGPGTEVPLTADPTTAQLSGEIVDDATPAIPGLAADFAFSTNSQLYTCPGSTAQEGTYFAAAVDGPDGWVPYVLGSSQSVWPQEDGGTFTFSWTY